MACSLDPFDVDQVLFLTEILISCRKLDLAILYLHEVVTRGSGLVKIMISLNIDNDTYYTNRNITGKERYDTRCIMKYL